MGTKNASGIEADGDCGVDPEPNQWLIVDTPALPERPAALLKRKRHHSATTSTTRNARVAGRSTPSRYN